MQDNPKPEELDEAMRARLSRLASVPVDTSKLKLRLSAAMAEDAPAQSQWRLSQVWRPVSAVAAAILIVVMVGFILMSLGNSPAMAAPNDMARLYSEANHSGSMLTPITSIDQANRLLAGQWSDLPQLPAPEAGQLHACCIHDFMDRKVACLILQDGQTPLTLVVGHAREFRPAEGRVVERNGRKFTLHDVNGLRMAMTQQGGTFICLMGDTSEDRLLDLASSLKF